MKYVLGLLLASSLLLNNVEASIPKCSDCTVFATGKDGTLWGWEDDSFCKLPSSCGGTSVSKTTTIKRTSTTKKTTTRKTTTSTKRITTTKAATTAKATTAAATTTVAAATTTVAAVETDANGNIVCSGCVVTGTGGENSLWGWENEKSCIIDQEKCKGKIEEPASTTNATAEANHKKNAAGHLICNTCNVTATGGDGSFWGYEDDASCIIDNAACKLTPDEPKKTTTPLQRGSDGILICSTCEYTRIDEDTTTWNVENGEECRVIGSRCGFNKTPHPWCSGCVVTGTGGDGALYGWENSASCLINEVNCGLYVPGSTTTNGNLSADSKVEVDSSATKSYASVYYFVATLLTIFIVRGF